MKTTRILHAVFAAAFVLGPIPILIYAPSVIAQQMRIDKPNNAPRGVDGCVPIGVSKSPNGLVYAIEECHGVKYKTRMN